MGKNPIQFSAFLFLALFASFHWSCEKDATTPAFITAAKSTGPGIPSNLYSLVVSYHCANCHNPSAGPNLANITMDLRTRQSCFNSWVGVAAQVLDCSASATVRVVPGDAVDSMLWQRLDGTQCAVRMPYDGPPYMSQSEIDQFKNWINNGDLPQ